MLQRELHEIVERRKYLHMEVLEERIKTCGEEKMGEGKEEI